MAEEIAIQLRRDWRAEGLCTRLPGDRFFPAKGGHDARQAKWVCARCPVRAECLQDAIERDEPHGFRGGMTVRERRRLRARTGCWSPAIVTDADAGVRKVA